MKRRILKWLEGFLYSYYVSQEDYEQVIELYQRAAKDIHFLRQENTELLNTIYDKGYKRYEQYSGDVKLERINIYEVNLKCFQFTWRVEIPEKRFFLLESPKDMIDTVKENMLQQLTKALKEHMRRQLFK